MGWEPEEVPWSLVSRLGGCHPGSGCVGKEVSGHSGLSKVPHAGFLGTSQVPALGPPVFLQQPHSLLSHGRGCFVWEVRPRELLPAPSY